MDTQRFDHLTRLFSTPDTRRRVLGLAAIVPVLGGLFTLSDAEDVLGRRRHRHHVDQEKKKKKKKKKKKACKPQSTATVCAGKCGTITNAQTCNKPVNCEPCDCVRTTCAAQGKTCGTISDGCGGSLACGSCSNPTPICTDNVCVACGGDTECGDGMVCCGGSCAVGTWSNQTTFGSEGSGLSQFNSPYGVAVLTDGLTAWVADVDNRRISVWTRPDATSSAAWTTQTTFGSEGSGPDQFSAPFSVAVSADALTAWVADYGNSRISVWSRPDAASTAWSNQTTFGSAGSSPSEFTNPFSVAVSADALTAWVADYGNNRISVWSRPDATSTAWSNQTTFGSAGSSPSEFSGPKGVAGSADGLTAFVADTFNDRISIWTRPTTSSTAWTNQTTFGASGSGPSELDDPADIALSADELTIWVADAANNRISVWTRPHATSNDWTNETTFGSYGSGSSQFDYPEDVAVSPDGLTVWVADPGNDRISIWVQGCSA